MHKTGHDAVMFGWLEFIIIAGVLLLFFGGKRIPGLANGIGKTLKNFRYGVRGDDDIKVKRIEPDQDDKEDNDNHAG